MCTSEGLIFKETFMQTWPALSERANILLPIHQAVIESSFCLVNPLSLYFSP